VKIPTWWPPKVGDQLRRATVGADVLLHVMACFTDKDGNERVVTAERRSTKSGWDYAVIWWYEAAIGLVWRDGTPKPEL